MENCGAGPTDQQGKSDTWELILLAVFLADAEAAGVWKFTLPPQQLSE